MDCKAGHTQSKFLSSNHGLQERHFLHSPINSDSIDAGIPSVGPFSSPGVHVGTVNISQTWTVEKIFTGDVAGDVTGACGLKGWHTRAVHSELHVQD